MTSFRLDIGAKARRAGRTIGAIRSNLLAAVIDVRTKEGLTQQQIAERAGMCRQDLNGVLSGNSELTLRLLAEIAHALDKEIDIVLRDPMQKTGSNYFEAKSEGMESTVRQMQRGEGGTSSTRALRIFVTGTPPSDVSE